MNYKKLLAKISNAATKTEWPLAEPQLQRDKLIHLSAKQDDSWLLTPDIRLKTVALGLVLAQWQSIF